MRKSIVMAYFCASAIVCASTAVSQPVSLGSVSIGSSVTSAVTITIPDATTLASVSVLTMGAPNLDFTDAGDDTCIAGQSFAAGSTCTVNVAFSPKFSQMRSGAVVLADANGIVATMLVEGTGVGPQLSFQPPVQSRFGVRLRGPRGVAVDGAGNLYVTDMTDIVKETYSNGSYTQTLVPVTGLKAPARIAIDGAGNLYISDYEAHDVIELIAFGDGYIQRTVTSNLEGPIGIAVDSNQVVYIVDYAAGQVLKETPAGSGYSESLVVASGKEIGVVNDVAVGEGGRLFLVGDSDVVYVATPASGQYVTTYIASNTTGVVSGIALDQSGNFYLSADNEVIKESLNADYRLKVTGVVSVDTPGELAIDGAGNLYTTSLSLSPPNAVVKLGFAGPPVLDFGTVPYGPSAKPAVETFTISNIGNADLQLPIPDSGENPTFSGPFALVTSGTTPCPVVLATSSTPAAPGAGSTCEYSVGFRPTVIGAASGSLTLTDNNLNATGPQYATQVIQLSAEVKATQTITFRNLPAHVPYGAPPVIFSATGGGSRNPITFTVTGPARLAGDVLKFTGAGTVTVTANQAGNAKYFPAVPTSATVRVLKVPLVFTAGNTTRVYGKSVPAFHFGVTGFVNGDTVANAYHGSPSLQATSGNVGKSTIEIGMGSLTSKNYSFKFVDGTLTVLLAGVAAKPTFLPPPGIYGSISAVEIEDSTMDAMIYYTLDGSEPTKASTRYAGQIYITQTTTIIKAIAIAKGYTNSPVVMAKYTITN